MIGATKQVVAQGLPTRGAFKAGQTADRRVIGMPRPEAPPCPNSSRPELATPRTSRRWAGWIYRSSWDGLPHGGPLEGAGKGQHAHT